MSDDITRGPSDNKIEHRLLQGEHTWMDPVNALEARVHLKRIQEAAEAIREHTPDLLPTVVIEEPEVWGYRLATDLIALLRVIETGEPYKEI